MADERVEPYESRIARTPTRVRGWLRCCGEHRLLLAHMLGTILLIAALIALALFGFEVKQR